MKLQFKHQPFQAEAVCDVFNGQPMRTTTYCLDLGNMTDVQRDLDMTGTGFRNHPLVSELTNARYGWSKFIILVPSMAIREGVCKSLQTTQEHFAGEYSKKIRFFIYSSDRLIEVNRFASDSAINVMVINMQAFNASKNQRIMDKKLDTFRSRLLTFLSSLSYTHHMTRIRFGIRYWLRSSSVSAGKRRKRTV